LRLTLPGALALCSLSIGSALSADGPLGFVCDEPSGKRVEVGDVRALDGRSLQRAADGPQWTDDGYRNVRPSVVIDSDTMKVTWGNALPDELIGVVKPQSHVINVPITGRDSISVYGTITNEMTVEIFRYYLNYDVLYRVMTSVGLSLQPLASQPAMSAIYVARCRPF